MKTFQTIISLFARLFLGVSFIWGGVDVILNWHHWMAQLQLANIPLTFLVEFISTAFLILGGVSILLGYKARVGALLLILVLVPATIVLYGPWNSLGVQRQLDLEIFFKNMALFGGLLYVLAYGSGQASFDGDG